MTRNPSSVVKMVKDEASREADSYRAGEDRPLGSYVVLMGTYTAALGAMVAFVKRSGRPLPDRPAWPDLALLAVATHRLARLVAKDPVTSPLRAPFTRYQGTSGPGELSEQVRGHGVRKAVGELLTCPFCIAQWLATVGMFGLVVAPRVTRAAAGALSVVAGADVLQFAYAKLEQLEG